MKISIWLEVRSPSLSLTEISEAIGLAHTPDLAKEKGDRRSKSETWEETYWRYEPDYDENGTLRDAVGVLLEDVPRWTWSALSSLPSDSVCVLNIGMFLQRAFYHEGRITAEQLADLADSGVSIEITAYSGEPVHEAG